MNKVCDAKKFDDTFKVGVKHTGVKHAEDIF